MFRLCFGLSSITISLLLVAEALGLVPDREGAVNAGPHEAEWGDASSKPSTATHLHVPIALDGAPWGTVELCFRPIALSGFLGLLGGPSLLLFIFMGAGCFFGTYFFLG